jgi:hypothetical protein
MKRGDLNAAMRRREMANLYAGGTCSGVVPQGFGFSQDAGRNVLQDVNRQPIQLSGSRTI